MTRQIEFKLKQSLPFASNPTLATLEPERVLCNDVVLPWERHPHNMRLWVIGHIYGAVCAVWASHEQDALDTMIDEGLGDSFLVSEEDQKNATPEEEDEWAHLGNAGEACNLDDAWMAEVDLAALPCELLCKFAEARGANAENLDQI